MNELIKRKRAEMIARKVVSQIQGLTLMHFEEENSEWVTKFQSLLKRYHQLDSKPEGFMSVSESRDGYLLWLEQGFDFLKDKEKWVIVVPNCDEPIWAEVLVNDFKIALSSLWEISDCNEFVIADKTTSQVGAVFCEDNGYELHKGIVV